MSQLKQKVLAFLKQKIKPIPSISNFLTEYKHSFHKMKSYAYDENLFDELYSKDKFLVSMKIDGMMCVLSCINGVCAIYTKKGFEFTDLSLFNELKDKVNNAGIKEIELIGELYARDINSDIISLPFNISQSIVTAPKTKEDEEKICFYIYDVKSIDGKELYPDTPYLDRLNKVKEIFGEFNKNNKINCEDYIVTDSIEQVKSYWDDKVLGKFKAEGIVLYIPQDEEFIKIKKLLSYDIAVIGIQKGKRSLSNTTGSLIVAFMNKDNNYVLCGTVGSGLTIAERYEWYNIAKQTKIDADPRIFDYLDDKEEYIFIKPDKVVEVDTMGEFLNDEPVIKFQNNKYTMLKVVDSVLFRQPRLIRQRDDKDGTVYADVRIEQVEMLSKSAILVNAGYPSHPDKIVIDNEQTTLSEDSVWQWYNKMKDKILPYLKDRVLALRLATDTNKETFIRHEPKGGDIKINTEEDYDRWNNGRMLSFGIEMKDRDNFLIIDLDPKSSFSFDRTKEIAAEIYKILDGTKVFKNIDLQYSGADGFHIFGYFKEEITDSQLKELITTTND